VFRAGASYAGAIVADVGASAGPVGSVISAGRAIAGSLLAPAQPTDALADARARLNNRNSVTDAMRATTNVESRVRADTSISPTMFDDTAGAYARDRAAREVHRHDQCRSRDGRQERG
jgi:hypothetical protein